MIMHELLKEHIKVISIENDIECDFLNRYLSHLSDHNHLGLSNIGSDIKSRGVYTSAIMMTDATIDISITGHCDYFAMLDKVVIGYNEPNNTNKKIIENLFEMPFEVVLKHLTIKYLFNENNPRLIDILTQKSSSSQTKVDEFEVIHSLNNPSFAYKGDVVFDKTTPETRKSVAKHWFLVKANEIVTHERSQNNVWLAVKVITLRKDVKKTFYEINTDPRKAIEWLATPLALRDPSLLKMLFDMKASDMSRDPILMQALVDMEPFDVSPPDIIGSDQKPLNLVPLDAIKERFQETVSDTEPFSIPQKNSSLGQQGINPYTISNPMQILDSREERKSIRFETGNLNHRVLTNEPDKYIFDGWLVGYINSKDFKLDEYECNENSIKPSTSSWFELFIFKTDECYYATKINRTRDRIRNLEVGKPRKVKNDRNIGSIKTVVYEDLEELLDFYETDESSSSMDFWLENTLKAHLI